MTREIRHTQQSTKKPGFFSGFSRREMVKSGSAPSLWDPKSTTPTQPPATSKVPMKSLLENRSFNTSGGSDGIHDHLRAPQRSDDRLGRQGQRHNRQGVRHQVHRHTHQPPWLPVRSTPGEPPLLIVQGGLLQGEPDVGQGALHQ
eukprot:CAMPEP_0204264024 /NCGR_PEP_ID=MMETSP0468-20130131/8732_1 /ASSEMBLY_ACC=CAM_ASM_000383 /TAXON_ID=2969 /ORGANISM="Oxyrrhis marina" /LENGTH=144 /DNA_ID=CAMNT_0051238843 /DNA_START=90 /DNA_END=520 /DNA_ORIENTATION=+